jgi:Ca2+ regulator and membrane fusion protein Fig1
LHKSRHPYFIFWYFTPLFVNPGICLSDNTHAVECSSDIWNFASNAQNVDPLMAAEFAKELVGAVCPPYLLILSIVVGLTAFILTMVLFLPLVFSWRHARNLHFLCIVMAGAAAFFLFMTVLQTKFGVQGGMAAVPIISLTAIAVSSGQLTEAFLWTAWALWSIAFFFVWLVRWWEILERREKKAAKAKKDKEAADKKKKDEEAKKKKPDAPIKADPGLLQEMAAAQM